MFDSCQRLWVKTLDMFMMLELDTTLEVIHSLLPIQQFQYSHRFRVYNRDLSKWFYILIANRKQGVQFLLVSYMYTLHICYTYMYILHISQAFKNFFFQRNLSKTLFFIIKKKDDKRKGFDPTQSNNTQGSLHYLMLNAYKHQSFFNRYKSLIWLQFSF